MHASLLLREAARSSSAASVVRQTLLESGPLTTQALHSILHAPTAAPLPAQQLPFPSALRTALPRQERSHTPLRAPQDGDKWSVTYLKKKVLAGLEAQGDVVKTTRHRYEVLAGLAAERKEALEEAAAASKGKGKGKAQQSKKEEQEHVWVHRELYERAATRFAEAHAEDLELQAQQRAAKQARGEKELRDSYGLEGGRA
ncbi:hypothetical protein JCM10213_008726 [Rhodosporidiobolus nylandii]